MSYRSGFIAGWIKVNPTAPRYIKGGGGENGRPESAFLLLDERDAPSFGGRLVVGRAFSRMRSRRQLKYRRALARHWEIRVHRDAPRDYQD
jgi:hypothetical protein